MLRHIPAAPKPPPAPQAKPVKNAARNMAFSVTTGASGSLTATARTPANARTPTAAQKKRTYPAAATATRPASRRERAPLVEGSTTAVTTGARGHPPATARTPAAARAASAENLSAQNVPVAQQPAAPKRSAWSVVGHTAKKTQITMIWCITMRKPPPARESAGMLTTPVPAPAANIPLIKKSPH